MINLIFIGYILSSLELLHGWCLFWYIVAIILNVNIKIIKSAIKLALED